MPSVTMGEVADAYYATRREMGVKHWDDEARWFNKHAASLRDLQPKNVTAGLIETALLEAKKSGLSEKSFAMIKGEVSKVLHAARKQRLVTENVAELVDVPRGNGTKKKRVQLTDAEFFQYINHPDTLDFSVRENERRAIRGEVQLISREVKTLSIVARCIGGARASDCHALTWDRVDLEGFKVIEVFRPKVSHRGTERLDRYVVPEAVRPFLIQWWADHGKPDSGPMFPCTLAGHWKNGIRRYGGHKKKVAYADVLRRDLLTAGVARHELHYETARTLPTGFHDHRRALVSAMRRANVEAREAMAITSHTSWAVHQRYDVEDRPPMVMPANALPSFARPKLSNTGSVPTSQPVAVQNSDETKSSQVDASSGELRQMNQYKSIRTKRPEPPETLAATGTYGASEFPEAVEAPGIEAAGNLTFAERNAMSLNVAGHDLRESGSLSAGPSVARSEKADGDRNVEQALADAITKAATAGAFDVLPALVAELAARRTRRGEPEN
ncbi:MAG: hypothetical protein WDO69_05555 [Pseudomonadota bacterium]